MPDSDESCDEDVNIGASTSKNVGADIFTGLEQEQTNARDAKIENLRRKLKDLTERCATNKK